MHFTFHSSVLSKDFLLDDMESLIRMLLQDVVLMVFMGFPLYL
jgi:hypothetical protein